MPWRVSARSKYGAKPQVVNGQRFASKAEMRFHQELQVRKQLGEFVSVECQPRFPLVVNGELVAVYVGDFTVVKPDGEVSVIDVKGYDGGTPVFKLKARMFEAIYGFPITTVQKRGDR